MLAVLTHLVYIYPEYFSDRQSNLKGRISPIIQSYCWLYFVFQGGNDYEIFSDSRTIGHTVNGPEDTMKQLKELFF